MKKFLSQEWFSGDLEEWLFLKCAIEGTSNISLCDESIWSYPRKYFPQLIKTNKIIESSF